MALVPWFIVLILFLLLIFLDLSFYKNKSQNTTSLKNTLIWSILWISTGLSFSVFIYLLYENHWFGFYLKGEHDLSGANAMMLYLSGYLVEESLSMDNLFVIAIIFETFGIPQRYQHKVLYLGILGAIVLRALFILAGLELVTRFQWLFYIFGLLLIHASWKMLTGGDENKNITESIFYRFLTRNFRITDKIYRQHFMVRHKDNKYYITPLFIALFFIEISDLIFAIDSIPAVFAITTDPYIAFTSNIFAILGLRSLYFVLSYMVDKFHYLKYSLAAILFFIGFKMLAHQWFHLHTSITLSIIILFLFAGILYSIINKKDKQDEKNPHR